MAQSEQGPFPEIGEGAWGGEDDRGLKVTVENVGEAQATLKALRKEEITDYVKIKVASLNLYEISLETYNQLFQDLAFHKTDQPKAFANALWDLTE
uniref:Uncharacterized protein n=1 Tax=Sphaerodactylus townsendi TaxID=933632 RepID=A0ACB8G3R1_9SAUR